MQQAGSVLKRAINGPKNASKFRRYTPKVLLIFALSFMLLYLTFCVVFTVFQERFIYTPYDGYDTVPSDFGLEYETILFEAEDGTDLVGWYVAADNATYTVLACHGNRGNIGRYTERMTIWNELGLNVFVFDYRGYGESSGSPSEDGTHMDAEAAYQYLLRNRGVQEDHLIVLGRSLGGPMGAKLAVDHDPCALILESTFTSYPEAAKDWAGFLPVDALARIHYPTIDYVQDVDCPVLVVHSKDDVVIDEEHGRKLYDAAPEPKEFVLLEGDHGYGYRKGEVYSDGLDSFLTVHVYQ